MKKYTITEEQIKRIHECTSVSNQYEIEKWFPDLFKLVLEVGKWHKSLDEENHIFCVTKIKDKIYNYYGFNSFGNWRNNDWYCIYDMGLKSGFVQATDEEVKEALTAEAKRRGYTTENTKSLVLNSEGPEIYFKKEKVNKNFEFCFYDNKLYSQPEGHGGKILFHDGIWAEIIEEPKEVYLNFNEIAAKFGVDVNLLRITKQ